ncbi:TPA: hypothetical protein DEW47_02130 [Patescibacteria group bacterium]|nr:MAG: Phenylalanine-tRNA ligase beta subunit [Parcubacteria group bacterium GW2011_GWF2_40_10]KKR47801.1 MAG: Phenylalanine-tRNA ligase beta subunit [Parcubacteria group bacterium GW2011_GWA2_40_143]KKR60232.1 MAG: Phenylalanine-tRNA ligase beta subunit [Parcubacteria group bacterium GW2011_GWC2_40_31]KKR75202.1 MAG: Phenylalanine-tRNA ligase beta subunit [Parcubacteria group bacterium GW2011_GWB2_40_8]KKR77321.1 MAG: Phenylalanine-tRNA ligase beta subunit [Parcubacteria group bacterium GW201
MELKYSWLQSFFETKLPEPNDLAELLTMRSLELESVVEKDGDFVFDIAMLPSRKYDYIDYHGAIRDISAILKLDIKSGMVEEVDINKGKRIYLQTDEVEKKLGIDIAEEEVIDILTKLGFKAEKKENTYNVMAPHFRPDIELKEDVVEEIARIYGYEKIEEKMPEGVLAPPKRNDNYFFAGIVRNIIKGLGYDDVYNYSFASHGDFELKNPIAKGKEFMRKLLTLGLEKNNAENSKNFKEIKIFEIGKVFPAEGEIWHFAALSNKADFYEMKGVADAVLIGIGINDYYYEDHDSKVAEVHADGKVIGHIDHNTFEFNFDEMVRLANENLEYKPISRYPIIARDIAIFVPADTKVEQVLDVIENTAGELLVDTDLFDIFEKEGRKSLAFRLMFQSPDKTLTDEEVNEIRDKIFKAMEDTNSDWEIRR